VRWLLVGIGERTGEEARLAFAVEVVQLQKRWKTPFVFQRVAEFIDGLD
jgi:hypothetical protein